MTPHRGQANPSQAEPTGRQAITATVAKTAATTRPTPTYADATGRPLLLLAAAKAAHTRRPAPSHAEPTGQALLPHMADRTLRPSPSHAHATGRPSITSTAARRPARGQAGATSQLLLLVAATEAAAQTVDHDDGPRPAACTKPRRPCSRDWPNPVRGCALGRRRPMSPLQDRLPAPEPRHAELPGHPTITAPKAAPRPSRAEPIGHPPLLTAEAAHPEGTDR